MIQKFVDQFMAAKPAMLAEFKASRVGSYRDIFSRVVAVLSRADRDYGPDPERVTAIDHGDYQGTHLFIVGRAGYQPDQYWYCLVGYGSCSGCDALEAIQERWGGEVGDEEASATWTLALHMVQSLKAMGREYEQ